jgi:hypothetical protein
VLLEDLLGDPGLEEVRRMAPLAQDKVVEPLAAASVLLPPAPAEHIVRQRSRTQERGRERSMGRYRRVEVS